MSQQMYAGGALRITSGTFNMYGGKISGGHLGSYGGDISDAIYRINYYDITITDGSGNTALAERIYTTIAKQNNGKYYSLKELKPILEALQLQTGVSYTLKLTVHAGDTDSPGTEFTFVA